MGHIREVTKKNGEKSFHAEVRLRGFPPLRDSFRTRTQAKQWIQEQEAAMRDGRFKNQSSSKKYTVSELIDRFISTSLPKHPIYFTKKAQMLNRWKEELGHLLLSELSPSHVASVRDKLLEENTIKGTKRSNSTVNRYLAAFSKVLSVAVKEWEWLRENPILKIAKPKENRGRDRFLDHEDIKRLREACKQSSNPFLYPIVSLAILTGMRYGEIVNLKWRDVSFSTQTVTIQQSKNGEKRFIPITEEMQQIFQALPNFNHHPDEEVFVRRKGAFTQTVSVRKSFAKALQLANIDNFRFHDLRHTAASHLAMNGATQHELMTLLGHKTPAMTRRYAHFSQKHLLNLLEKTNQTLSHVAKEANYA